MILKSKNKALLILKVLFMICWAPIGHQILNKNIWQNMKENVKNNLRGSTNVGTDLQRMNIFLKAKCTSKGWEDADTYDMRMSDNATSTTYRFGHLTPSICEQRADSYMAEAISAYNSGNFNKAAYRLGYAMHYIQDMACPVHAANIAGDTIMPGTNPPCTKKKTHGNYEQRWGDYGIDPVNGCNDMGNCSVYNSSITDYVPGRETALTKMVGTTLGHVYKDPKVKQYLSDRVAAWVPLYNVKNKPEIAKALKYSLAMAICIQKRYLRKKVPSWIL